MTEYPQVGTHKTVRAAIKSRSIVLPHLSARSSRRLPTPSDASEKKRKLFSGSRDGRSQSDRVSESFLLEGNRGPCGPDKVGIHLLARFPHPRDFQDFIMAPVLAWSPW